MSSDPIKIKTVAALSRFVEKQQREPGNTSNVLYRGHGAVSFKLLPKVGRYDPPERSGKDTVNEKLMLELFRRRTVDSISVADADDWELLAIAQHPGLPTRLLDWTRSPLVALFFAVCHECESRDDEGRPKKEDAEIIVWRCPKQDLSRPLPKCGPLKIALDLRYVPRNVTPRLRAQHGLFTAHADPQKEYCPKGLTRLSIPYKARKPLKDSLFRLGINEEILFPDLDGLARHIQWCQTKSH